MRLINADALMARFQREQNAMYEHGREYSCSFLNSAQEISTEWFVVEELLENSPTIDAVPVVRCRDCKFRKDGLPYKADGVFLAVTPPVCGFMTGFIKDDGWCFKGERKDNVDQPD